MKRILRAVLDWLERKFPDRIVVTMQRFEALEARVNATNYDELRSMHDRQMDALTKKLEQIQMQINQQNVMMGLTPTRSPGTLER